MWYTHKCLRYLKYTDSRTHVKRRYSSKLALMKLFNEHSVRMRNTEKLLLQAKGGWQSFEVASYRLLC